jgi:hypothetical protein
MKDLQLGDRVKVSFSGSNAAADANWASVEKAGAAGINIKGYSGNLGYQQDTANDRVNGRESSFLFVVGIGLDVLKRSKSAGNNATSFKIETIRGCVALAKSKAGYDMQNEHRTGSMMAITETTTENYGATAIVDTWAYTDANACYLDVVADDKDFYIAQSFETHGEHDKLISGTDLTSIVPLHLNVKFAAMDTGGNPHAPVKQGDLLTCFLHLDSVLRLEPDGSLIASN